jgi:hypothetical protein
MENDMKLTFGKFKGEEIENVPTSYLNWLAENLVLVQEEIQNQLKLRSGEGVVRDRMYIDKHRMGDG